MKVFDADKTRMIWLPYGEKTMTIYEAERYGQTDGQNCYISVPRQCAHAR